MELKRKSLSIYVTLLLKIHNVQQSRPSSGGVVRVQTDWRMHSFFLWEKQSINKYKRKNIIAGLATKSVKSSGTNLTRPIRNLLTNIERTQTNENITCVLDWSGVLNWQTFKLLNVKIKFVKNKIK